MPNPDIIQIHLRIPRSLHEQIVGIAAAEDRSMNNAIVWLLKWAIENYEAE